MGTIDDLHTLVRLLKEFDLPVSPILEYAIKEKERELMHSIRIHEDFSNDIAEELAREEISRKYIRKSNSNNKKTTILRVIRPDGSIIEDRKAYITMGAAIKEIGVERVRSLDLCLDGMNIIMDGKNPIYPGRDYYLDGKYYLNTHSSTMSKAKHLEKMIKELGLDWKVEIVSSEW